MNIPEQQLGSTGVKVTMLGLGGEGMLRSRGYDRALTEDPGFPCPPGV